jgi:hypothetical protein
MVMLVNDGRDFFDRLLQLIQNEKGVLFGVFAAPGQSDSAKHAVLRRQVKPQDWEFTMPGTSSRTTYLSRSVNNTVPSEVLFGVYEAERKARRPSLVYCGDDQRAKELAAGLIRDVGFDPVHAGPLQIARYVRAARCPARVRRKRGAGAGLPVRGLRK